MHQNFEFNRAMIPSIEYTVNLIKKLHQGQTDPNGKPYASHPQRVAEIVKKIAPQVHEDVIHAALLHDTIEDCSITCEFLIEKGYSISCIEMVELVTKPENDRRNYEQVIDDLIASGNQGAMIVKLADNIDNMNPVRVENLRKIDPDKAARLYERYERSIHRLLEATNVDPMIVEKHFKGHMNLGDNDMSSEKEYEYFFNGVWPIRAEKGEGGVCINTEIPNIETGSLISNLYWLDKVFYDMSGDFTKISREEFEKHCSRIYEEKNLKIGSTLGP